MISLISEIRKPTHPHVPLNDRLLNPCSKRKDNQGTGHIRSHHNQKTIRDRPRFLTS